ncbi:hypothetical protein JCM17478_26790 [Thermopirellula anaerolimosa]
MPGNGVVEENRHAAATITTSEHQLRADSNHRGILYVDGRNQSIAPISNSHALAGNR